MLNSGVLVCNLNMPKGDDRQDSQVIWGRGRGGDEIISIQNVALEKARLNWFVVSHILLYIDH